MIWQIASPKWNFDDATFDRSAASFDKPVHVVIVIHNYRWRWPKEKRDMPISKSGLPNSRSSGYRSSGWKATRMVRHTRIPELTPRNSPANMSTDLGRHPAHPFLGKRCMLLPRRSNLSR